MFNVKSASLLKYFLFILMAALVVGLSAGDALAARSGYTTPDPGPLPEPDPDPGFLKPYTRVSSIDFKVDDSVYAAVKVVDQSGNTVPGASVAISWTYPDGSQAKLDGTTGKSGIALFELTKVTGEHKIDIVDVTFKDVPFNASVSQLSGSVTVGE